jgi:2-phospho-L-lactate guanylyltransferase
VAVALIPVKELSQAKARLSPVLDAAGRRTLALAMFRDVLAAALACDALEGVAVVTRDEEVLAEAGAAGAEGLVEPGGLNEALTSAAGKMARRGVERVVIIAADIPLATPDAIAATVAVDAEVTVAPSLDGGTNVLVTPPDAFPLLFGKDSARRHLQAARAAGLRAFELAADALAFDIDAPEDLQRMCTTILERAHVRLESRVDCGVNTAEALTELGLLRQPVP